MDLMKSSQPTWFMVPMLQTHVREPSPSIELAYLSRLNPTTWLSDGKLNIVGSHDVTATDSGEGGNYSDARHISYPVSSPYTPFNQLY